MIVAARLIFASPTGTFVEKKFKSQSAIALAGRLPDLATAETVLSSFAIGRVAIGGEEFLFPSDDGGEVKFDFEPFRQGALQQSRLLALTGRGRTTVGLLDFESLDWEVKSASPPYLGFQELLLDFSAPIPQGNGLFESFYALPVAIDGDRSRLNGTTVSVCLKAERGIRPDDIQLGLIAIKTGEPADRQNIPGTELAWQDDGQFLIGSVEREVPAGRAVQAIASLQGSAFHFWWLVDPHHITNPRKGIFELIDPGLSQIRDLLSKTPKGAARELESAVAWLFWMLGYSVAHLGAVKFTQDAVDLLVATPRGNFALVECTTGVISVDKKVPNLLRRRAQVLEMLARSSHNAVRVLPILVTSCTRAEVEQEIAPAQQRGVLVLTRTDLEEMVTQANLMFDADDLYQRAETQVTAAEQAPELPGIG